MGSIEAVYEKPYNAIACDMISFVPEFGLKTNLCPRESEWPAGKLTFDWPEPYRCPERSLLKAQAQFQRMFVENLTQNSNDERGKPTEAPATLSGDSAALESRTE